MQATWLTGKEQGHWETWHTSKHPANLYSHDGRTLPQGIRQHTRRKINDRATMKSNPSCPDQLVMPLPS